MRYDSGIQKTALPCKWKRHKVTTILPEGTTKIRIQWNAWEHNWDSGSADDFSVKVRRRTQKCGEGNRYFKLTLLTKTVPNGYNVINTVRFVDRDDVVHTPRVISFSHQASGFEAVNTVDDNLRSCYKTTQRGGTGNAWILYDLGRITMLKTLIIDYKNTCGIKTNLVRIELRGCSAADSNQCRRMIGAAWTHETTPVIQHVRFVTSAPTAAPTPAATLGAGQTFAPTPGAGAPVIQPPGRPVTTPDPPVLMTGLFGLEGHQCEKQFKTCLRDERCRDSYTAVKQGGPPQLGYAGSCLQRGTYGLFARKSCLKKNMNALVRSRPDLHTHLLSPLLVCLGLLEKNELVTPRATPDPMKQEAMMTANAMKWGEIDPAYRPEFSTFAFWTITIVKYLIFN